MLLPAYYEPTVSYKGYKNQKFQKHTDLLNKSIRQIKDCSLKKEDKQKLMKQLVSTLTTEIENL